MTSQAPLYRPTDTFYVPKESQTYSDVLIAYGLAHLLHTIFQHAKGDASAAHWKIWLEDGGSHYLVRTSEPVQPGWVNTMPFPGDLAPFLRTSDSESVPDGVYVRDVNAVWERIRQSSALRASASQENSEMAQQLSKVLIGNLYNNATFRKAALPLKVATPCFARYEKGMTYGDHIDDPVMGQEPRFRCDVACTVFLNDPQDYEGGELVVRTAFGDQTVKLPAGDAVVYPASSLHHVAEVSRGQRLVAVTWLQSMVRDPARRELLYELNLAREKLMREKPDAEETAQVDHSYTNLVRMWAEV